MKKTRTYRTEIEWQSIIQQWQKSGLSAPTFCKTHKLGYASFCQWRQRLADNSSESVSGSTDFMDLSPLPIKNALPGWQLSLRIGDWLELRVQR